MNIPHHQITTPSKHRQLFPYKKVILKYLKQCKKGGLIILEGNEHHYFGDPNSTEVATLEIRHPAVYRQLFWSGHLGAAEAYMQGYWDSHDLTRVIQFFTNNIDVLNTMESKQNWYQKPFAKALEWFNKNSLSGSKKNIHAHYDLSNEFFASFLDKTMNYSSAVYPSKDSSLFEAQEHKMRLVCEKLDLQTTDHVLEIGTGWAGMSIYMAENYGCQVTTTTISEEQHAYAQNLIRSKGLESQITLLKKDYRHLNGQYDKLVSIEMIEAVGKEFLNSYFQKIDELIKPDGLVLIQAIAMKEENYQTYCQSTDFIRRYIFPGSHLVCKTHLQKLIDAKTQLSWLGDDNYAQHYAKTLKDWNQIFQKKKPYYQQEQFDERFKRMWEFYLCYCEAGFAEDYIELYQFLLKK